MNLQEQILLLEGLKKNNKKNIDAIYKLSFPMVKSYILNNNGNINNVEDIFQESMIILFQKVTLDANFQLNCNISTYLYEVCKRLWLKNLRDKNSYSQIYEDDINIKNLINDEIDLQEHEEYNNKINFLKSSLEKLGEPCTSLLKSFYTDNKKMSEICKLFNYTNENNAKTQKYKCLMRLKKIFFQKFN